MTTLPPTEENYLTGAEVARFFRKGRTWVARNPLKLPRIRIGNGYLYPKSGIDRRLRELEEQNK